MLKTSIERFNRISKIKDLLSEYDWLTYFDADMYCVNEIKYEEFFDESKDFFGVQHPGFLVNDGNLPFERNLECLAGVAKEEEFDDFYMQGCVWGGKVPEIFKMVDDLKERIKQDLSKNIVARGYDESYLNKYRIENADQFNIVGHKYAIPGNGGYYLPPEQIKIIHSPANKEEILGLK